MATEDRETYRVETGAEPASPSRRFARMVGHPGPRRMSPRRLAGAVVISMFGLALAAFGGGRLLRSVAGWIGSLPEYQLPFSRIELIPEPPAYIRAGARGFLERVRFEDGYGETIPLLSVALGSLGNDFRLSPWVKAVARVERSPARIAVHLSYRAPVAVVGVEGSSSVVIDEEGTILPKDDRDTDWLEKGPNYRVRGVDAPLIEIHGVSPPSGTLPGLRWKESSGDIDLQVQGAARLAAFLKTRDSRTPAGKTVPRLAQISPMIDTPEYYLRDAANHWIFWGPAPGAEEQGMPKADAKWAMLQAWIDEHGSLPSKADGCLVFHPSGARVGRFTRPTGSRTASGG